MRRHIMRGCAAAAATVILATLGFAGPGTAAAGRTHTGGAAPAHAGGAGTQLWVSRYNGAGNGGDGATSVAVSPDGTKVFVTGSSYSGKAAGEDYVTVAYSAVTGARLWVRSYNGPASKADRAASVAVSPGGTRVLVTGSSETSTPSVEHPGFYNDYATVAYDAATGAQLWVKRYNGPAKLWDAAAGVAVARDGSTVFVTGTSWAHEFPAKAGYGDDWATVAYNAATGAQLWVKRYNGPASHRDFAASVVSPGNGKVYVTGTSTGKGTEYDYATVAYSTATGAQLWVKRYRSPGILADEATSLAVNPARTKVFVTGSSGDDYATVAYNAATGAQLWVKRYNGPARSGDTANSVAVARDGTKVFVTGFSNGGTATRYDYATVAYNAFTGAQLWVKRYNGPGNLLDVAGCVRAGNGTVYVTGNSDGPSEMPDYATIAYNAATGAQLWVKRYNGPGNSYDMAASLAVNPSGTRVFVTGASEASRYNTDYGTIAYRG
jgi:outer membrane protein assembly factor BamB